MNAQYQTGIQNRPPQTAGLLQQMHGMQSPYQQYGPNHQDVMQGLMARRGVDMSRYAQQMQDRYATQQQQAEMQNALAGLQQLSQDRQNQTGLQNSRLQAMLGFQGDILGGLLR